MHYYIYILKKELKEIWRDNSYAIKLALSIYILLSIAAIFLPF